MMPRYARACMLWACVALLLQWASIALSHEVRPALLQIVERSDGRHDVLWKRPTQGNLAVRLVPRISGGLLSGPPTSVAATHDFQITSWQGVADLDGKTLEIEGLAQTITDVLVSITPRSGSSSQTILTPDAPAMALDVTKTGVAVPAYVMLGVEHILVGIDHLAFVLALILLAKSPTALITTVTGFTVAHSLTLVATAVGLITPRADLIEALVALSIVFIAIEVIHGLRDRQTIATRYPWVIAFTFGLLHGSAFASALAGTGLPRNAVPMSLLLFNVGVELGQLAFIAAVMAAAWMVARVSSAAPSRLRWSTPYVIGILGAYWFVDRMHQVFA